MPFVFVAPLFKLTRLEKNKGGYVSKETVVLRRWGKGGGRVGIPR